MSNIAISIKNLSKVYRIGLKDQKIDSLSNVVINAVKYPFTNYKRLRGLSKFNLKEEEEDMFWALKNISLDIQHGEVLGIVGKNGAGKSTLLKILSRITEPTSGKIKMYGRSASLLEVGTGFNPELTGRENTFLNGTILGMTKKEIQSKFDEIVDFSGVEKFIDTPVKKYSSGMRVRLAFAVAAHLEPEILIIDEVLAVGDAEFQKKCLGKMEDVAKKGRTVIFVSHNMSAVKSLCTVGFVLDKGQMIYHGNIDSSIQYYLKSISEDSDNADQIFTKISINGGEKVINSEPFFVKFIVNKPRDLDHAKLFIVIRDVEGNILLHKTKSCEDNDTTMHYRVDFPQLWLQPGIYTLDIKIIGNGNKGSAKFKSDSLILNVESHNHPTADEYFLGKVDPICSWNLIKNNSNIEKNKIEYKINVS